jgi:hypothetical protein
MARASGAQRLSQAAKNQKVAAPTGHVMSKQNNLKTRQRLHDADIRRAPQPPRPPLAPESAPLHAPAHTPTHGALYDRPPS